MSCDMRKEPCNISKTNQTHEDPQFDTRYCDSSAERGLIQTDDSYWIITEGGATRKKKTRLFTIWGSALKLPMTEISL